MDAIVQHRMEDVQHETEDVQHGTEDVEHTTEDVQHGTEDVQDRTEDVQDRPLDSTVSASHCSHSRPLSIVLVTLTVFRAGVQTF